MNQKNPNSSDAPPKPSGKIPRVGAIVSELVEYAISTSQHSIVRAAESGRSRLEERQLRKDLDHFWVRLGKTSFHLLAAGEIDHPALHKAATRINTLERQLEEVHAKSARGKTSAE
jgi:hypothetical protein